MLTINLDTSKDAVSWANRICETHHYLKKRPHPRQRPMIYTIKDRGERVGLVVVGIPHATKNRRWWGYEGLPTQWQVVDLCRIWVCPKYQRGGELAKPNAVPGFHDRKGVFRPTVASWAISNVLGMVQVDRISMYPPVYLDKPYHIELVISYHDPQYHKGTIYKVSGATPMYTRCGSPVAGPSGKFGWCWKLKKPIWAWNDIEIKRPRVMRLI